MTSGAALTLDLAALLSLAGQCAPGIHPTTIAAIVQVESARQPYAIGVVGGRLVRQPRTLAEAVATAEWLEHQGWNFSIGIAQINRFQLKAQGLDLRTGFEPCANLRAAAAILRSCYARALVQFRQEQAALQAALSCYYAGNFQRGQYSDGPTQGSYVQRVWQAAHHRPKGSPP